MGHWTGVNMKANSPERGKACSKLSALLEDELMAEELAAYLDGTLRGPRLAFIQGLLDADTNLAREVEELRRLNSSLKTLGEEIIDEPIPDSLLSTVRKGLKRDS
jgi:anti-sigma factor RsiW